MRNRRAAGCPWNWAFQAADDADSAGAPPGTKLGPYEVLNAIGAGGMGEVYRARDTRLNRDVALKVLPALFADDPERLARFTREAQTLAALSHRGIAGIYGVEESPGGAGKAGTRALVMELVPGDDLSARIGRGPISEIAESAGDRPSVRGQRSRPRTIRGSSIAISSPPTSRWRRRAS